MAYNRPRLPSGALKKEAMGKDIEVAILFADVVGSTQLYEQLGDAKARADGWPLPRHHARGDRGQ